MPNPSSDDHSPATAATTATNDLRINILFTRLGAIYGQNWWNNYPSDSLLALAKEVWSEGLQRFNNQILKEVLVLCREKKIYPPSLPQFIEYCKAAQNRKTPSTWDEKPVKPSSHQVATMHIKAMLKHLTT